MSATAEGLGDYVLVGDGTPTALACENETDYALLYGAEPTTPYPKNGIADHVMRDAATVSPDGSGTKAALWYQLTVPAGGSTTVRLRLADAAKQPEPDLGDDWESTMRQREAEADAFWAKLTPAHRSDDEATVVRQAL